MSEVIKPQLFDVTSGAPANLPEDQIPQALDSGKFAFQKGAQIPVINADGKPGTVPAEFARQAFSNGFQYEPSDAQLDRIKTDETSGTLNAAKAFGAGALRGPTLGLSDQALTRSGMVKPETLSDLQKYRPGWSMAGEVAGIGADAIFNPIGASAAVGRAGSLAKGAVEGLELGKLAEEGTTASKILGAAGNIGAAGAGSAVEGALYGGLGNTITEQALGDPNLNAEKIMGNFGYGALFGGALGTAIKGAEIAVPEAVGAARDGLIKMKNVLIGTGEKDAGLLGKTLPDNISKALENRAINLDVDQQAKLINETATELNGVTKNIESSVKDLNKEIRPKEVSALINSADAPKVSQSAETVVQKINNAIETMRNEPEIYSGTAARKLELFRDGLTGKITNESAPIDVFNTLRETKQGLQKIVFSKIPTSQEAESINILNGLSKDINGILKDPEIFGAAGSALAEHDSVLSKYYKYVDPNAGKLKTPFEKSFMTVTGNGPNAKKIIDPKKLELAFKTKETVRGAEKMRLLDEYYSTIKDLPDHIEKTYANVPNERFESSSLKKMISDSEANTSDAGTKYLESKKHQKNGIGLGDYLSATIASHHPVFGAAIQAYKLYTRPIEQINKLAQIERLAGKITSGIGRGAKAIFDPTVKGLGSSAGIAAKLSLEDKRGDHKDLSDKLSELQNNPSKLLDLISSNTEHLQDAAPQTSDGLAMAATRGLQFLAAKLPTHPNANPFDAPYEPSQSEIATFDRYRSIVENPLLALEQVKQGTIIPETIEALGTVFPKLYDEMKSSVMEQASHMLAKKEPIPYKTKQAISMFMGEPIDSSFTGPSIQANQIAFIAGNQQKQDQDMAAQGKPSKPGMGKISLAKRSGINHGQMES